MSARPVVVVAAVVTLALAACTAQSTQPTPSVSPSTRALTMLHIDGDTSLDPAIDWFVDAVEERSAGALTVRVESSCCGEDIDVEERLVERIAVGDGDLGWVGARVLPELGADALGALTAPFAIADYAAMQQVIASDEATSGLSSLEAIGVEGVAVVPGLLRYPLAAEAPILSASDWAGLSVASFHSTQQADALRSLGAEPLDVGFAERDQGILDGQIAVLENSLVFQNDGREEVLPYATVDLPLWGRVSALIAPLEHLSEAERGSIAEAAADVVARAQELAQLQEEAQIAACGDGARFALAGAAELEAMRAAVRPIWDALAEGEESASLMRVVADVAEQPVAAPTIPEGCGGDVEAPESEAAGDPAVLNGSYRTVDFSRDQLLAGGIAEGEADNLAGSVFTLDFSDGRFELVADQDGQRFGCEGDYTVRGDRVIVRYLPGGDCGAGGTLFEARFVVDASSLALEEINAPIEVDEFLFGSAPLERTGR